MSGQPVVIAKTMCPPLVPYAKPLQQRAAREIRTLGPDAALPKFMTDYGKLRDACRAISRKK